MGDGFTHLVHVRDRANFLRRLMTKLAGNARMSLEGNFSHCRFTDNLLATRDETAILKHSTIRPKQDFVILRLTLETVAPIFKQVMAAGLKRAILHVLIERDGVVELEAYDNFHPVYVVAGPGISLTLLDELKSANIFGGFKVRHRKDE